MEDAVHQPMTAHLEANAVAGISSSAHVEAEVAGPAPPTILTSPYGAMSELVSNVMFYRSKYKYYSGWLCQ